MYHGIELENGGKTLGLEDISKLECKHPDYMAQNIKQHAGYAAEVISTTKENLAAKLEGSGIQTYRADDRPDLYAKNDQYVDKIRVNSRRRNYLRGFKLNLLEIVLKNAFPR